MKRTKKKAPKVTATKPEPKPVQKWYVDITEIEDEVLANNVYIGSFEEAIMRTHSIAKSIEMLVAAGMPQRYLGVRMGLYRILDGGDA